MSVIWRKIIGTEQKDDRLVFRAHCLSCLYDTKSQTAFDSREKAKDHLRQSPDHLILVGQGYLVKMCRTRGKATVVEDVRVD